jgi:hypothetical protein
LFLEFILVFNLIWIYWQISSGLMREVDKQSLPWARMLSVLLLTTCTTEGKRCTFTPSILGVSEINSPQRRLLVPPRESQRAASLM